VYGRDQLIDKLVHAGTRRGALVLLRGAAGSGLTSLLGTASAAWQKSSHQVVSVAVRPGPGCRLEVLDQLLQSVLGKLERSGDSVAVRAIADSRRLRERVAEEPGQLLGLVHAVGTAILSVGGIRPPVVVIDQVAGLSGPAAAALGVLLHRLRSAGCPTVVGYQQVLPATVDPTAGWELAGRADLVLDLEPIGDDRCAALISRHHGRQPVDGGLLHALRDALGVLWGNPGTVKATMRELRSAGRLTVLDGYLCLVDPDRPIRLPATHPLLAAVEELPRPVRATAVRLAQRSAVGGPGPALPPEVALAADPGSESQVHVTGLALDELVRLGVVGQTAIGWPAFAVPALGPALRHARSDSAGSAGSTGAGRFADRAGPPAALGRLPDDPARLTGDAEQVAGGSGQFAGDPGQFAGDPGRPGAAAARSVTVFGQLTRSPVLAAFRSAAWDEALSGARRVELERGRSPEPGAMLAAHADLCRILSSEMWSTRDDPTRAGRWLDLLDPDTSFPAMRQWARCGLLFRTGHGPAALEEGWQALRAMDARLGRLAELRTRVDGPGSLWCHEDRPGSEDGAGSAPAGPDPAPPAVSDAERAELLFLPGELARLPVRLACYAYALDRSDDLDLAIVELDRVNDVERTYWSEATSLVIRGVRQSDLSMVRRGVDAARTARDRKLLAVVYTLISLKARNKEPWLQASSDLAAQFPVPRDHQRVTQWLRSPDEPRVLRRPKRPPLSPMESRIIELVAGGLTNRQVAGSLNVSEKTVESNLTRLFAKTGCRSRVELAAAHLQGRLVLTA
jgi:DNA-binding CsgD family transcriptional regulator